MQFVKDVCLVNDWQYLLDVAPHVEEEVIGFSTARSSNFGKKPWPYVDERFEKINIKTLKSFILTLQ